MAERHTYRLWEDNYQGGANGNGTWSVNNRNCETGEVLNQQLIFSSEQHSRLCVIVHLQKNVACVVADICGNQGIVVDIVPLARNKK